MALPSFLVLRDKEHRQGTQNKAYKTREQNKAKSVHASRHALFHLTPVNRESSAPVSPQSSVADCRMPLFAKSLSASLPLENEAPFK